MGRDEERHPEPELVVEAVGVRQSNKDVEDGQAVRGYACGFSHTLTQNRSQAGIWPAVTGRGRWSWHLFCVSLLRAAAVAARAAAFPVCGCALLLLTYCAERRDEDLAELPRQAAP